MATPRTEYYNFEQTYNLGALQPIGYGPFPVDNSTGFTTLRFSELGLGTARVPQAYVQTDNHLNIMLFDPSDPTKYATYKSNPIATGTATDPGTSTSPMGGATFTDGDYSISTDVSDWNLFGGINSLDGLCVGFYSNAASSFPTTTQCPNGHLSPVPNGSYKYWMWEMTPATGHMKYSKDEMVEKYANSIDSCPIFADRSTKDANGDQIDTTYLKSANATGVKKITTSLPPVSTPVSELDFFTNGRVRCDYSDMGLLAPYPAQADSGKILQATWAGSPSIGGAVWVDKPTGVPNSAVADEGKVLTVNDQGAAEWQNREHYFAGNGLAETTDLDTGDITFSWAYTVGRNLHINQNDAIQTNLPGANFTPQLNTNSWQVVGDFATMYRFVVRYNTIGGESFDMGIQYYGSGINAQYTLIGTQTVATSGSTALTTTKCNHINETTEHTYCSQLNVGHFDPATMESMIIEGTMFAGTQHAFRGILYVDGNSTVQAAFTAIEVGKVGSTL